MLRPLLLMKSKIAHAMMKMHVIMAFGKTGLHVTAIANRHECGIEVLLYKKQKNKIVRTFAFLKSSRILLIHLKMFRSRVLINFGIIELLMVSKHMVDHSHISQDLPSKHLMNFIPILRLVIKIYLKVDLALVPYLLLTDITAQLLIN